VAILEQASQWGVCCHKLEQEFDAGDVLRTLEFPLSALEWAAATIRSEAPKIGAWISR